MNKLKVMHCKLHQSVFCRSINKKKVPANIIKADIVQICVQVHFVTKFKKDKQESGRTT